MIYVMIVLVNINNSIFFVKTKFFFVFNFFIFMFLNIFLLYKVVLIIHDGLQK